MAQASEQNDDSAQPAAATHNINGEAKDKRRPHPKDQKNQQNRNRNQNQRNPMQFYPDKETALPGTSHFSSAVVYRDVKIYALELQRCHHRHSQFVGQMIHQLENATLSKYRDSHFDLCKEAIGTVYDRLDSIELELENQKAEIKKALEGQTIKYDASQFSNPKTFEKVPMQTMGGLKWLDLLESADELISLFYQSMFCESTSMDGIEKHSRVNEVVKLFNPVPNFISNTNKDVAKKVEELNNSKKSSGK